MPQAQNITVKNGTALDKTFELVTPAAGDGGVAQWALKDGPYSAAFTTFTASATKTSNRSRKLQTRLTIPSLSSDGLGGTIVGPAALVAVTVSIPATWPENMKDDLVAFYANLANHPLVKAMVRDAYSAT